MKSHYARRPLLVSTMAWLLVVSSLLPSHASNVARALQREHLTPEEIEQVRNNQALDSRMEVFVKAVERRWQIVSGEKPDVSSKKARKQAEKDAELLGDMPEGTRAQLISDIAKILDEAIVNIDDAAVHAAKSPLVPKALRKLAAAADRLLPQFAALRDKTQDTSERESLELAIEHAQSIVEAVKKLAAETKK